MDKQNAIQRFIMGNKEGPSLLSNRNNSPSISTNYTWWIIFILFLSFIGVNVFFYLSMGTEYVKSLLSPLFGSTIATVGETVNVATTGAQKVLDISEDILDNTREIANSAKDFGNKNNNINVKLQSDFNTLNRAINTNRQKEQNDGEYEASASKNWCYVGEYDGIRTCRQLKNDGMCMSGNIFPTKDVCINPNLRQMEKLY